MLAHPNTQDKGVAQKRSDNGEEKFKWCMLINFILGNFCHLNYLFQKIHPCDKEFGPRSGYKRNKSADGKSPVKQTFEQIICLYPCWIILHYRKLLCTSFFFFAYIYHICYKSRKRWKQQNNSFIPGGHTPWVI